MTPTKQFYTYEQAQAYLTADERYANFLKLVHGVSPELARLLVNLAMTNCHEAKMLLYSTAFAIQRVRDFQSRAQVEYHAMQEAGAALLDYGDSDYPDDPEGTRLESEFVCAALEYLRWSSAASEGVTS